MLMAKDRCRVTLATPLQLKSRLLSEFTDQLENASLDPRSRTVGTVAVLILKKDFRGAKDALLPLKHRFKQAYDNHNLTIIEAILYSLVRNDLLSSIILTLNKNQTECADNPFYLYFSILKNLVNEIQAIQSQRKSRLQGLWNLFDGLSELE